MIHLSAFADEIARDLDQQIEVLHSEKLRFIDLRSIWGVNILDMSDEQLSEAKKRLDSAGIQVAAIASPFGKTPIDSDWQEELRRFERALYAAQYMQSSYIRIFSFYPASSPIAQEAYRDEVISRLREVSALAGKAGITLLHENEKDIYGDTTARNVDLFEQINDPAFRAAFDPANYLQCAQVPYPDAYEAVRPWLSYVHVKDVDAAGRLQPAGQGDARWPALLQRLRADKYDGFFALEPHLFLAEQFQGFSGPDLFKRASQALQGLLQDMHWEYA